MIYPDIQEVKKAAKTHTVIPVCKTLLADTETPVSVWMKLFRKQQYSFLLESVTGGDKAARYSFSGGNPYAVFKADKKGWSFEGPEKIEGTGNPVDFLKTLFMLYRQAPVENVPRFSGGAVGYFAYDSVRFHESIPDENLKDDPFHDIFFGFYKDIVAFDNKEHRIVLISNIIIADNDTAIEDLYNEAIASIESMEKQIYNSVVSTDVSIGEAGEISSNIDKNIFSQAVEKSKEYIKAGDIFQVVLSQRFSLSVDADPFDLYRMLRVVNPSPYMYFLNLDDTSVVGASPEMLVRVDQGEVETRPIAGTRRRGRDENEDDELIRELKADTKEVAEHVMLVDLGRNDVGRVCEYGSVEVEEMMHTEKYSHVIHLVTNVKGKLKEGMDAFDAFFSCFPAGTLSGAPKIRAMEIIDELESVKRGLYGGALGYIDFSGNMDTCIVIRTIVYHKGRAYIQAGAGVVADSNAEREYQETVEKASALFSSIKRAAEIVGN
ncbi:Anthranilate synthase, aminase component [Chitinispirillum alkaliphilum]|nr:Anthranilate synthase, aminase component [Chitinispirillum alkaliphilum]